MSLLVAALLACGTSTPPSTPRELDLAFSGNVDGEIEPCG